MTRTSVLALATLTALVTTVCAAPVAGAGTTPSPSSSPSSSPSAAPDPVVVVAGGTDPGLAVSFPVQDFFARSEDYYFSEASLDGAVVDTGDRQFRLASDVLFAFDKAILTPRARREISRIAARLKATGTGSAAVTKVRVAGYTDAVGSDGYNLRLSQRRAAAVRRSLAAALGAGITVTAVGRGEADPIAKNDTAAGRKANRRVEIVA